MDETLTQVEPQDPLAEGYDLLKEGDYGRALKFFTTKLAQGPHDSRTLAGMGIVCLKLKDWDRAADCFAKAREMDPEDKECWLGLGVSLASSGKVYPALNVMEALLEHHPKFIRGHIQAGLLYFKLCISAKGQDCMMKALELDPSFDERRIIETALDKEKHLDRKRMYRPDFVALNKKAKGGKA